MGNVGTDYPLTALVSMPSGIIQGGGGDYCPWSSFPGVTAGIQDTTVT